MKPRDRIGERRRVPFLLVATIALAAACATPPPPREIATPVPIDLAPRCLEIDGLPALAGPLLPAGAAARSERHALPGGATLHRIASAAPVQRVRLVAGFPWPETERASAEIAATLLREAENTPRPTALRVDADRLGARFEVTVSRDRLWLGLDLPVEHREDLAPLFARWLEMAAVPPATYPRARRRAGLVRLASEADPRTVADRAFDRWIGRTTSGATKNDGARDAKSVFAHMRTRLVPAHAADLLATAPLAREDVAPLLEATAGAPTGANDEARAKATIAANEGARAPQNAATATRPPRLLVLDRPGAPQVELLAGYATVPGDHPDAPALALLASGLGADVGGRLFADLRERQGLVYTIDARQEHAGRFVVSTRARPERVPALLLGLEAHLDALRETPFLDCELVRWRSRVDGERARRASDPAQALDRLRDALDQLGRPIDADAERATLAGLDADALGRIARTHLAGPPTVVLVGDRDRLRAAFARVAPERILEDFEAALAD